MKAWLEGGEVFRRGESRLGGEDYTDALGKWLRQKGEWKPEAIAALRWREMVEQVKRELSAGETATIMIEGKELTVSRADLWRRPAN